MNSIKRSRLILVLLCLLILFAWLGWHLYSGSKVKVRPRLPITVIVQPVKTESIAIDVKLPGRIEAVESVDVRSQVTGILQKINFTPGQDVKAGDLLFQIIPDSFEASLAQAQANLARDQAQYEETKKNEQRLAVLIKSKFVSEQEYGQVRSQMDMQKSTLAADTEKVREAQLLLNYTKILAPISGKTGNVTLKIGDLITSASTNPLVTINKINPVYANFNLPQNALPQLLEYKSQHTIPVEVWTESHSDLLGKGELVFIDNMVNTETGTVLLKALLPNEKELLWPSQLVMVKLIFTTKPNAIIIASSAVHTDDEGQFVYVVKNSKAMVTRVEVEKQLGKLTAIKSGLQVGDMVVTTAPPELQDESIVTTKQQDTQK